MTDREAMNEAWAKEVVKNPHTAYNSWCRGYEAALAQTEHRFDTPESHIVGWSIPVDPNNFGEPLAQPEPTPRQLQRLRQAAWKMVKQQYKHDPEVCFAMGFDAGYGAVASKVEPPQGECGGFDSRPAPRKEWVGLTDDEINDFDKKLRDNNDYCSLHFAWGISAKLKGKNNAV